MKEQLNLKNMLIYLSLMRLKKNTNLNFLIRTIIKFSRKKTNITKISCKFYNLIQGYFLFFIINFFLKIIF